MSPRQHIDRHLSILRYMACVLSLILLVLAYRVFIQ
jgi:hypothetical protein